MKSFFACSRENRVDLKLYFSLNHLNNLERKISSKDPASSSVWKALSLPEGCSLGGWGRRPRSAERLSSLPVLLTIVCLGVTLERGGKRELAMEKAHWGANPGPPPKHNPESWLCGWPPGETFSLGEECLPPEAAWDPHFKMPCHP